MDERILVDNYDGSLRLFQQARNEMFAGKYESAVALLEESNRIHPHYKTCLLLGECLMHLDRMKDAVMPLAAATALNRQGIAPKLLAEIFMTLNDPGRAHEFIKIAIERQPHYKRALELEPAIREASERDMRQHFGDNAEGV